jgi:hypothetical protein
MKQIELNKEHERKILEMCKQLFPELIAITIEPNGYINAADGEDTYSDLIHWFEFSWIILNKILNKLNPIKIKGLVTYYGLVCFNRFDSIHPVDYLYDKFIQIKKDETTKSH